MSNTLDAYVQNVSRLKRIGRFAEVARRLSTKMGKKINPSWVSHVASGHIDDAGFKRFSLLIVVLDEIELSPRTPSVQQHENIAQTDISYSADNKVNNANAE